MLERGIAAAALFAAFTTALHEGVGIQAVGLFPWPDGNCHRRHTAHGRAYYDVAYDRVLAPPATTAGNGLASGPCTPNVPNGTTTEYEEGIEIPLIPNKPPRPIPRLRSR